MNELLVAVKKQDVQFLRQRGNLSSKELNQPIEDNKTLLMIACCEGLIQSAEFLLTQPELDIDIDNGQPDYETALMLATTHEQKDIVNLFIKKQNIPLTKRNLNRALIYYANENDVEGMTACLEKGAEINSSFLENTALHEAVSSECVEATRFLLSQPSLKPNITTRSRQTALHFVFMDNENSTPLLDAFSERHQKFRDIEFTSDAYLEGTPLTAAIFAGEFSHATRLIEMEGEQFSLSNHPEALNWAVRKNRIDLVRKMLEKNSSGINLPGGGKQTVVDNIPDEVRRHNYEPGQSPIDLNDCNDLPLNWAVKLGHEDVVDLLLRHGAESEAQNLKGKSAKAMSQDEHYKFSNIKAKLSAQTLKPLRSSRGMQAIGIFKTEGPHSPEDTGRDKKESSPGREEKSIEMLLEERIKERAKQDAEFLARLEGLKAKVKEEKKLSSGSDEIPAVIAEAFQKAEAIIKESTEQDEKKLETFIPEPYDNRLMAAFAPYPPEDTRRDKKEASSGRAEVEKTVEELLAERKKERAKQDAELLERLASLKTADVAELIHETEAMVKKSTQQSTQQDEKLLENFKALKIGVRKGIK